MSLPIKKLINWQGARLLYDDLRSRLNGKVSEPATEGTSGQVLTTDGNGGRTWTTVQGGGSSVPAGGAQGALLAKKTDADGDVEWITPATASEQDNTRPITAGAVYTEIGNINALLETI